jgi:hypothetical protein
MNTISFDKKVICGPEFVALRIIDNLNDMQLDGVWLPDTVEANTRLAHCIIENVGSKAAEEYGIKIGDYVMIDRLSTFAHTSPVCMCRYNNVICKTNKDRSEYHPLRNMLFVELDEKNNVSNVDGVYIENYANKLNIGYITDENLDIDIKETVGFTLGDRVVMTKGPDIVSIGDRLLYIYKHDMIVCKVIEKE